MVGFAAGCASVNTAEVLNEQSLSDGGEPVAHLNVRNSGLYVLPFLPMISGSTDNPGSAAFFKDTVTVECAVDLLTRKSAELGGTVVTDIQSKTKGVWIPLPLPPFIVPIYWWKSVEVSGNVVK